MLIQGMKMGKAEVLELLKSLGNEKRKEMYIKNGASENTYGVLLGELRKIAKQLKGKHELGLELWDSNNTDAQWLACMLLDANKLTLDEVRAMVSRLTYKDLIDKFIGEVVKNHKDREILIKEWTDSSEDNLGRAGWNLIVHKISSGSINDEEIQALLVKIENDLQFANSGTQWAMNHALCQIGISFNRYTKACIQLGEKLGVYKDLKVSKGCTSAYAPNWISAVTKKNMV